MQATPDVRDRWRLEAMLRVGLTTSGPFALPTDEPVTFGRDHYCGLRADNAAASRVLARFVPSPVGWILENGNRTRVDVKSLYVVDASFGPRAHVLLQPGADWTLAWDLDVVTEVTIRHRQVSHGEHPQVARDRALENIHSSEQHVGTDVAGDHLNLTPLQRRRLGALFAYMIEGRPKPDQLIQTASQLSGDSIPQINNAWVRAREKVNRHREVQIETIEDLGYHLVEVSGQLGPDDVPDPDE